MFMGWSFRRENLGLCDRECYLNKQLEIRRNLLKPRKIRINLITQLDSDAFETIKELFISAAPAQKIPEFFSDSQLVIKI